MMSVFSDSVGNVTFFVFHVVPLLCLAAVSRDGRIRTCVDAIRYRASLIAIRYCDPVASTRLANIPKKKCPRFLADGAGVPARA